MDKIGLIIYLYENPKKIGLHLEIEGETIAEREIIVDGHFDHVLIESVDKLLKRNRINPLSLSEVRVAGHIDKNSSSHKMVTAFLHAINASKIAVK